MGEVEKALSLLVMAARTSPPLRDAVRVVEDEIRRLTNLHEQAAAEDRCPHGWYDVACCIECRP